MLPSAASTRTSMVVALLKSSRFAVCRLPSCALVSWVKASTPVGAAWTPPSVNGSVAISSSAPVLVLMDANMPGICAATASASDCAVGKLPTMSTAAWLPSWTEMSPAASSKVASGAGPKSLAPAPEKPPTTGVLVLPTWLMLIPAAEPDTT